ncbi:MAG: glutamine synthetase family protein [Pseudomonadota bacterium]
MPALGNPEAAVQAAAMQDELQQRGIVGVAFSFLDNSGIARTKGVPLARLPQAAQWGVGMAPSFDVSLLDDSSTSSASAGGPVGDLRLIPDLDALRPLVAEPGWAWAPVERWSQEGKPHPQCQRSLVRQTVDAVGAMGLQVKTAFEIEWMLSCAEGDDYEPVTRAPAYGSIRMTELSDYTAELLSALAEQGIEVMQLHPEFSPGQFELSVAHGNPLQAADDNMLARRTIRAVGLKHGMRTTYSPVVEEGQVGNGSHCHFSLWRDAHNLLANGDGPHGMSAEGEAFLAGILRDMPALLAVGAPSVASYLRLQPSHWSGDFQCWGLENREAALRFVAGPSAVAESSANAEVKCLDATASSYLVIAAIVSLGLSGVREQLSLPQELLVDPATLSEAQLREHGIRQLPGSLQQSIDAFAGCEVLRSAFGQDLFETLIAVRRAELALFAKSNPQQIIAATRWRY